MADHINISVPRERRDLEERIAAGKMKVELEVLQMAYDKLHSDLESIFTRISRGDQVELHYPDGQIVPITRARKRGGGEGGES